MNTHKLTLSLFTAFGILTADNIALACDVGESPAQVTLSILHRTLDAFYDKWIVCLVLRRCEKIRDRLNQGTTEFVSETYFHNHVFGDIIELHNQDLSKLEDWRHLFSQHARELANFVKTFPGAEALDVDPIREAFASSTGMKGPVAGEEVFKPWTHRWSGVWSNGSSQYHVWDQTQLWDGQWIQAVSQSEVGFIDGGNLEKMLSGNDVDLGINVYTSETGITGVSKRQHGRLELPHIGYLVEATTLIWITQPQDPDHLFQGDQTWFVFLEKVDSPTDPKRYSIYGYPFVIEAGLRWDAEQSGQHYGNYKVQSGHRGA